MAAEPPEEIYLRHAKGRFTDPITFSLQWDANGNLVYPKTRKAQIEALQLEVSRERLPDGSLTGKGQFMQAHLDYIRGQPQIRELRIATWNINGVRANEGALLRWLREQKPDLVALQKIRVPEEKFPAVIFDREGYHAEAHCYGKKDFGVAVLCRKKNNGTKPRVLHKGLYGQEELGARLLIVDVDGLEFSSVYAPYGKFEDIQAKLDWFECLIDQLKSTRPRPERRVLCGDFNVLPQWRVGPAGPPKKSPVFCRDVRAKFRMLLDSAGLHDLYKLRPPDWEDPFIFKGRQCCLKFSRLEYVLGTQSVVDRDPVVKFDFDYSIIRNGPFYWVRSPIVADLGD